uniref:Uncharacterized protein n=1 Tax=Anopheles albimanus TaxID=7167 RepID=A0A182FY11_ANOAL
RTCRNQASPRQDPGDPNPPWFRRAVIVQSVKTCVSIIVVFSIKQRKPQRKGSPCAAVSARPAGFPPSISVAFSQPLCAIVPASQPAS